MRFVDGQPYTAVGGVVCSQKEVSMRNCFNTRALTFLVLLAILIGTGSSIYASGFALIETGASGIGRSFAGSGAQADDPSCIFFNPAALTQLDTPEVSVATHVIMPKFDFNNEGSSYPLLGIPLAGGDGGNGGETAYIPNLYYSTPLSKKISVGIGIFTPFGLETDYDDGWVGRYHALNTDLKTVNINPSVAWRISEKLSFGGGLNAQYVEAKLTSAIDFGTILASKGAPGAMPQMLDGEGEITGDDWGYGYNLGLVYAPVAATRIGLAYRSHIETTLKGDAKFDVPAQAAGLQAMGMFINTSGSAAIDLPESATLSLAQQLGEKWIVMADVAWTRWSRFDELRVDYGSNQPDSVTEEYWKDSWRGALGLEYLLDAKWTLRAGTAYDETPIRSNTYRTPRIPDSDRIWLTCGARCQVTEALSLDAGYVHLFFNDSAVNIVGSTGDNLVGEFEGSANLISLQANYSF